MDFFTFPHWFTIWNQWKCFNFQTILLENVVNTLFRIISIFVAKENFGCTFVRIVLKKAQTFYSYSTMLPMAIQRNISKCGLKWYMIFPWVFKLKSASFWSCRAHHNEKAPCRCIRIEREDCVWWIEFFTVLNEYNEAQMKEEK